MLSLACPAALAACALCSARRPGHCGVAPLQLAHFHPGSRARRSGRAAGALTESRSVISIGTRPLGKCPAFCAPARVGLRALLLPRRTGCSAGACCCAEQCQACPLWVWLVRRTGGCDAVKAKGRALAGAGGDSWHADQRSRGDPMFIPARRSSRPRSCQAVSGWRRDLRPVRRGAARCPARGHGRGGRGLRVTQHAVPLAAGRHPARPARQVLVGPRLYQRRCLAGQVPHRGPPGEHRDHRQLSHPGEGAGGRRLVRPAGPAGIQDHPPRPRGAGTPDIRGASQRDQGHNATAGRGCAAGQAAHPRLVPARGWGVSSRTHAGGPSRCCR